MWSWRLNMPTQNLLRLLLLLMLMLRIVLAIVCCIFVSWGLILKLNFCLDYEHKVRSRFWSWCLVEILKMKCDPRVRCAFGNVLQANCRELFFHNQRRFYCSVFFRLLNVTFTSPVLFQIIDSFGWWRRYAANISIFVNIWPLFCTPCCFINAHFLRKVSEGEVDLTGQLFQI